MYAAIRQGQARPGTAGEIVQQVETGLLPAIRTMPGFVSYDLIANDDNTIVTITVFATEAEAEACNTVAVPWIREHLGPFLTAPPHAVAGRVAVHAAQEAMATA